MPATIHLIQKIHEINRRYKYLERYAQLMSQLQFHKKTSFCFKIFEMKHLTRLHT